MKKNIVIQEIIDSVISAEKMAVDKLFHMDKSSLSRAISLIFDIKGKVQQAKVKFSKGLDKGFNDMIERQTGTESFKEFSKGVAQRRGKKVGKFKIFVSPSAEDRGQVPGFRPVDCHAAYSHGRSSDCLGDQTRPP